ncbi:cation:proton antiporter domain-containing protein [Taibaiella soli]|uniref:Sodium:proton antiporter n=1 Tax=Taibaiella soli TaxID=1649169 RepID=A0A2W2BK25_9BACT|nr:cation:proton antiporter [Taibaiella soli]PZF73806.1 sodium:proton antiporter [Taibaiella soli]
MNHLPHLIKDLALLLIIAGITTLLFKRLKQPVVLGYLLAGLLVSPNVTLFPNITDIENIRVWADIGVIFLLFTLGLEFSFKKLMRIGGPAFITAVIEISAMLGIGFLVGKALGWPLMDCIFLGGIISIASTTIILRSFDELGVKNKRFAGLVFGVLIVEDLVAVVLLVLLSTIAVSRQFAGMEMLESVLKLFFFLMLWFVAGIFFIPSLLLRAQKYLTGETLLIIAIGLCLTMVLLASLAGFSPALGAFIMGSIFAETIQAERIEHLMKPVKDLFGAIFFVSVGMLIDPHILLDFAGPILLISVILVVGKTLHVTIGALIAGQPLKTSIYAGMSMGQIGEFSFIIATLGITLDVTSKFLYPIAVAVSVLTTFSTPYMIKLAGPLYEKVNVALPGKWKRTLNRYSSSAASISIVSDWKQLIRSFFIHMIFFTILIIGILILCVNYLQPWMLHHMKNPATAVAVSALVCLVILFPFLGALVIRKIQPESEIKLWGNKRYRGPLLLLRFVRIGLALLLLGILLLSFFPLYPAMAGEVLLLVLAIIFSRKIQAFYIRLENSFFFNFNHREIQEAKASRSELAPWDAHIAQFTLPPASPVSGQTLEEVGLREKMGVNIAMIKRGDNYTLKTPARDEKLYPGDRLFVIGTDDQLEQFRKFIEPESSTIEKPETQELVLKKVVVKETSFMDGTTIRESGIREKTNGLVVGLERDGHRILNPDSFMVLKQGDVLWIVGDEKLIAAAREQQ